MKIEYIDHSIGNNYGDTIELNVNLKKYPKLHRAILDHELKHTNEKFSLYDLKHDIYENKVSSFQLLNFMFRHPKSIYQFLPIYKHEKYGWCYDLNLLIIYSFLIILILTSVYISYKIF